LNPIAKLKLLALSPPALHVGVWQISSHPSEAKPLHSDVLDTHQSSWAVTTVKSARVTVQRGLSLRHLLHLSLKLGDDHQVANPAAHPSINPTWMPEPLSIQESAISLTLFLPDHHFCTFQMPCMPQWGPQDIEAESRLEAARLMGRPMEDVSLDFQVHGLPEGTMLATVMACESALVQAAMAMFEKLGFKLNSLSSHSNLQAYALGWKVAPEFLNSMVHGKVATF
jgi:hypothetical protein